MDNMIGKNKILRMVDPEMGGPLIPKENNLYFSDSLGVYFRINRNDKFAALRDPETGAPLVPKSDGTYYSEYLNGTFIYDEKRECYIPLFIMDLTNEKAHIEGDFLVGNNSNRRFPILPNGKVLLPRFEPKPLKTLEDIQAEKDKLFNQSQSEINRLLNVQYFGYKNEALEKEYAKIIQEQKELKEKLEREKNYDLNKMNEAIKRRGEKLNFITDLYTKMTRGEHISFKEIETLKEYKKEGLLPQVIDEIISYYNDVLSSALQEGRKL